MKYMKKLSALLLALIMVLSLTIGAAAAEADLSGHTYKAYQIFTGTQAADAANLGNIEWGSGVNGSALLSALKADKTLGTTFANCESAADVAAAMEGWADKSTNAMAFAEIAYKCIIADEGIACVNGTTPLEAGYYLVVDVTTFDDDATNTVYNLALLQLTNKGTFEIAVKVDVPEVDKTVNDPDANIGDTVTFTLTATMPSKLDGYETYKVIFHDTLSAGLDFVEESVSVKIGEKNVTSSFTVTENSGNLTISCDNVLAETVGATASSQIVVTYNAILDDDAVIGSEGNPNEVYLEYSNNPNWDGTGDEPTGDTPEDEVKVYTWEIPVFKYTGTDTPLAGAGFTLYKDEECTQAVNLVATEGSNVYKVCTQSECNDHTHVTEIITGESGKFEIEGLEKGTYYLKETTTPAGYNTCDVVTVVIGENGALTQNGTATDEVAIQNNSGATLPETGGMGTTLFYIVGGVLVLAAVVLLVTKKRMASAE